jgi:glycine/D-amino acid oxidase-like deaminating enzyme/nitrite reductase/ring-hydroxylating ferredoxin subunit
MSAGATTAPQSGELPGRGVSPWLDAVVRPEWPALKRDLAVDVAVLGGGMAGVSAALALKRSGARVALLEARRIGEGVTGNSTAKLTSLHGLTYARLRSRFGDDVARAYGEANQAGIAEVTRLVDELGIDCQLRTKPNFTYTEDPDERELIEDEVEAALALGLPASYVEQTDLPFPVAGAVRFDDQAEFDPLPYLLALAGEIAGHGSHVFERTRATSVSGTSVGTAAGATVDAEWVVVATHLPFLDRGLYFVRTYPERSYALGVRLGGAAPEGMYLSTESPSHTLRAYRHADEQLLLVGGEAHKPGAADPAERYLAVERYARERFPVAAVEHRWSAHDNMPIDGLPFIGRLWPGSSRVLTVTGLRKWGLALGASAAGILSDAISGRESPWAGAFDTNRLNARWGAVELVKENADSGRRFFFDRVLRRGSVVAIEPGEGRVVRAGAGQVAVHRDDHGRLHAVAARCTHLGCIVGWNAGDRTWDCPCHGSRFAPDGAIVSGPAVAPLTRRDAPSDASFSPVGSG